MESKAARRASSFDSRVVRFASIAVAACSPLEDGTVSFILFIYSLDVFLFN
jgi:hypothetical protein